MSDTPKLDKRNDFLAETLSASTEMNLDDFAIQSSAKPRPNPAVINEISNIAGMPSREPKPRANQRFRTGRNIQLCVKVTAAVRDDYYALADKLRLPLGAVLEAALASLKEHG